ncbi:hypothetical protein FJTKL_08085 [Diaporthe vaccinii]|uniref:Saccharopine dehydrogenase NADP binding domain-containing protein n=1 Tax=Diaporthe vaccinii TaxID=105482 RepID=A0ABR4FEI9_9PEZI
MAKFFLVGGTGHVGGAVLDLLCTRHLLSTFEVLVRSEDKAKRLRAKYPRVQAVIGDLKDYAALEAGAEKADIVINAAPDITHDKGIGAILRGLTSSSRNRKGYYIHTSGASCIYEDPEPGKEPRVWDDIADIDELLALSPDKTHIVTDNAVRAASSKVSVAIISPSGVAGVSPSIEHPFPLATGVYIFTTRSFNSGFEVNHGINRMPVAEVDVLDLARTYLILVNNAVEALEGPESAHIRF